MYKEYKILYSKSQKSKNVKEKIENLFEKIKPLENKLNKDLSEFDKDEAEQLIKSLCKTSRTAARNDCSYLNKYCLWLHETKIVESKNIFYEKDSANEIINIEISDEALKNGYFDLDEIIKYTRNIYDVSNKFILYAMFLGISGDGYSDLANLKVEDVDKNKQIVFLRLNKREVEIDNYFIELMEQTIKQQYYYQDKSDKNRRSDYGKYIKNGFVLRPTRQGKDGIPLNSNIFNNRLNVIKQQVNNESISKRAIERSALLNYIKINFKRMDINFNDSLMTKYNNKNYKYEKILQDLIYKFGLKKSARTIRIELKEVMDLHQVISPDKLIIDEHEINKFTMKELLNMINDLEEDPIEQQKYRSKYIRRIVMILANGVCQLCNNPAPFKVKNEPFLEEHHIDPLEDGGEDSIINTIGLCPNCHRKMHYAWNEEDYNKLKSIAKYHLERSKKY